MYEFIHYFGAVSFCKTLIGAAAGVAGHNFPVYYRFKGGRGMSSLYGGLLVVDWLAIPVATIIGCCIGFWLVHYAFLSYFGVMLFLVAWFGFRFGDLPHLLYALTVNVFFWLASVPDLKMYLAYKRAGEFNKIGNRFSGLDREFILGRSFVDFDAWVGSRMRKK